jgi:hypothetical protein
MLEQLKVVGEADKVTEPQPAVLPPSICAAVIDALPFDSATVIL